MNISEQFLDVVKWNITLIQPDEYDRLWDNCVECVFTKGEGTLLHLSERSVYLEHLKSITPRQGNGKRALAWFSGVADDLGTMIYLHPCAPDRETNPEAQSRLLKLYEQFNFRDIGSGVMLRKPATLVPQN